MARCAEHLAQPARDSRHRQASVHRVCSEIEPDQQPTERFRANARIVGVELAATAYRGWRERAWNTTHPLDRNRRDIVSQESALLIRRRPIPLVFGYDPAAAPADPALYPLCAARPSRRPSMMTLDDK